MVRKRTFTRDQVIAGAVTFVCEQGWSALTARTLAAKLGSSTMPIYTTVGSLEQLEEEVRLVAMQRLIEQQRHPYTTNPLLNLAIGYVVFARDEPKLFRFLFVERPRPVTEEQHRRLAQTSVADAIGGDLPLSAYLNQQDPAVLSGLALKGWIFCHGLASLVVNGNLVDLNDDAIRTLMEQAGAWEQQQGESNPQEEG